MNLANIIKKFKGKFLEQVILTMKKILGLFLMNLIMDMLLLAGKAKVLNIKMF